MSTARTLQDQELMSESKNFCLQSGAGSENNLAERRVESTWLGKATGRDSVNATISMCTEFLVGTCYSFKTSFGFWRGTGIAASAENSWFNSRFQCKRSRQEIALFLARTTLWRGTRRSVESIVMLRDSFSVNAKQRARRPFVGQK